MPEKYFGRRFSGTALDQAATPQVVGQIVGGDTVEAVEPLLEARVVGIDMLDVKDLLAHVLTGGYVDQLMRQAELAGRGTVDAGTIAA